MKISKLIENMNKVHEKYGDIDVVILPPNADDEPEDVVGISVMMGDDDKPIHAAICDQETQEMFL